MKEFVLENGIKLMCDTRPGSITSFCIGFNAGALEEKNYNLGIAHAVEHMVFKGTKKRTEKQINEELDNYFGFNNAMTNYPYAIYYGTVNSEDFVKGFELYSDIILNPTFPEQGFIEEKSIILEELRDWKDDSTQRCEDLLFANCFEKRRIRELIIGNEQSIENITLNEIKEFYTEYYCPSNCVITVISSLNAENIYEYVNETFGKWLGSSKPNIPCCYEENKPGIYKLKEGNESAKLQFCFDIQELTWKEVYHLFCFNMEFGEGTSSILFDEVRTKKGLAYEVGSSIKIERGIKLFSIQLSTSKGNVDKAIDIVNICVDMALKRDWTKHAVLERAKKRFKLKESLLLERSIELCKRMAVYELMFENYKLGIGDIHNYNIDGTEMKKTVEKVLKNPSIQIFS